MSLYEFLANPSTKLKKYAKSAKRQAAGSIEYNLKEGLGLLCTSDADNKVKCILKSGTKTKLAGTSTVMPIEMEVIRLGRNGSRYSGWGGMGVEVDDHIKKKQQKEMFGETFPICTLMIAYNYSINKPPIIFQKREEEPLVEHAAVRQQDEVTSRRRAGRFFSPTASFR
jgi:hypothetical protein